MARKKAEKSRKKVARKAPVRKKKVTKPATDAARLFLRHTVATLAYRCGKALRGAPESFAEFKAGPTTRKPIEILAHIGGLLRLVLSQAERHGRRRGHSHSTLQS